MSSLSAHRQFCRTLKPIGNALFSPTSTIATRILARMKLHRHTHICGTWVLADVTGAVFTMSEVAAAADSVIAANHAMLVGRYCAGAKPTWPTVADLIGDLDCHLELLRRP